MHYFLYYTLTTLCNLRCGYCFKNSLRIDDTKELTVEEAMKLIDCLYNKYNVRKISISGGEPTFIGGKEATDFLKLIDFLRQFKHKEKEKNLRIILLTNAVFLTPDVTEKMQGVVDRITVTVDSLNDDMLTKLGRNTSNYKNYLERIRNRFEDFTKKGFELKLHTVVSKVNKEDLVPLVECITHLKNIKIEAWKFFEYQTFGCPETDKIYLLEPGQFTTIVDELNKIIEQSTIKPGYKDIETEESTMFNLLADGRLKYSVFEDGKWIFKYTKPLTEYDGWNDVIEHTELRPEILKLHELKY